ncbi:MAG: hypothetical protein HZC28_11290 [Spirochaetes bacterium]|nr:hypothetical protein [Spirochaetota bacterium]
MNAVCEKEKTGFILDDVVLIGRTFDEYFRMFRLSEISTEDRILDAGGGVSAFAADATRLGYDVTALDPAYHCSHDDLAEKCAADLALTMMRARETTPLFRWDGLFGDVDDLTKHRRRAYLHFLDDYQNDRMRYHAGSLPATEYADNTFDIGLVSHLLFLYDAQRDYEFHKRAVRELARICSREVRIFPLINLAGERSVFLKCLMHDPDMLDLSFTVRRVPYEFLKGADEMLVVRRKT